MAEEAVQGIIQALLAAKDRGERRRANKAQEDQRAAEFMESTKLAQDRFKELQKQHDLTNKRADLEQQAVSAFRKAQQLKMQQEIAGDIMKTGVMPLGSKLKGQTDILGGAAPEGVTPPELVQSQTFEIPDFGEVTLPGRQAWAQEQAGIERTLTEPETEARVSVVNAQKSADFQKMLVQKNWDDSRAREDRESREAIAAANNAARIAAARLRANNQADAAVDIAPYVEGTLNGDYSAEEINRLPLSRPTKMSIHQAINSAGGKALTKDEKDLIGDFKATVDTLRLYDQFLQANPVSGNVASAKLKGALASFDPNITTPEDQLDGRASILARVLAREKGAMSNKDIERAKNAYLPSRFSTYQANVKKRDDLLRDFNSVVDAKLQAVPSRQRAVIKKKLGLLDLTYFNQQKTSQPTANGTTNQTVEYDWDDATKSMKPRAAGVR